MLTETIQHFYTEHREHLEQVLQEFDRSDGENSETRHRIFQEFRAAVDQHMDWEEKLLYPVFEMLAGKNECGVEAMRREHHAIRQQLARMEWLLEDPGTGTSLESRALRDLLESHCEKEESTLYPMLDEFLTFAERSALLSPALASAEAREVVESEQ